MKAKVNTIAEEGYYSAVAEADPRDPEWLYPMGAVQSAGSELLAEVNAVTAGKHSDAAVRAYLRKSQSIDDFELQGVAAEDVRKLDHDVTVSYGLLTNPVRGGLKTDLSLAFEHGNAATGSVFVVAESVGNGADGFVLPRPLLVQRQPVYLGHIMVISNTIAASNTFNSASGVYLDSWYRTDKVGSNDILSMVISSNYIDNGLSIPPAVTTIDMAIAAFQTNWNTSHYVLAGAGAVDQYYNRMIAFTGDMGTGPTGSDSNDDEAAFSRFSRPTLDKSHASASSIQYNPEQEPPACSVLSIEDSWSKVGMWMV